MPEPSVMTLEMEVDAVPAAAGRVRAAIVTALDGSLEREVLENVLMVATELVSNSVMHAGMGEDGHLVFRLRADRAIRVEVTDTGRGFSASAPRATTPGRDPGGRGLMIVELLSEDWGVTQDDRVTVWAELSRSAER